MLQRNGLIWKCLNLAATVSGLHIKRWTLKPESPLRSIATVHITLSKLKLQILIRPAHWFLNWRLSDVSASRHSWFESGWTSRRLCLDSQWCASGRCFGLCWNPHGNAANFLYCKNQNVLAEFPQRSQSSTNFQIILELNISTQPNHWFNEARAISKRS
jgi:hypothetical protein